MDIAYRFFMDENMLCFYTEWIPIHSMEITNFFSLSIWDIAIDFEPLFPKCFDRKFVSALSLNIHIAFGTRS